MSLIPKGGNDKIYTPRDLSQRIIAYFNPDGLILEPAKGDGAFSDYMDCDWCEIDEGKDFFDYEKSPDWVITNPPFSLVRKFLLHSYEIGARNIVFLVPVNHILGMKARLRDMKKNGYSVKELILIDTPKEFPSSGFQYCVAHIVKGRAEEIKVIDWQK